MKLRTLGSVLALGVGLIAGPALAEYPERPINMIIPYGAGGATDISARTIAEPLGSAVGEALVMANVTGAGGATGSVAVQNAKPDGYTMLFARVGSHSVNPAMKATLPYTLDDFRFVTVYEINPVACAVRPDSGIDSMDALVAKVAEGGVSYSSSGVGSLLHLAGAMVLKEFGVEDPLSQATHIPQQGGGAAATAVLNGTATFICTNSSALASFVSNGQLKPLMVTTAEPVVGFDAPTANDLGKPALNQLVGWTGIAGPDGLPDDVATKWGEWMAAATEDETFRSTMEARGSVIELMDPEEANAFILEQYNTFRALVDELGMRIEG
ncbi:tripartite tricarboxylate transporter substrate binding protein [Marivita sp. XM-24bin2]|jgi:tripartite-type tricarboxylate transporter receptor subunit TctC|uniref:Bug family tripartite tricarboxylate transporter substrate binding protein n=1 Tax=unclassified Marivita TaxID=2632480 RepID=UPI000D7A250A|nr:tripartite tricarboxylate transporter substrate binding protein [Marivita sp. XM-24bin2]MCR9110919.1 tripartite tricarboxylate transporter substrate binding protein [Paracoccaceae bacterium]PWL34231.1 MAG: tripartite tricarboxylate transporter substrate binding protein [Marivita sp. XM-24bin2]